MSRGVASYDPSTKIITVKDFSLLDYLGLEEELFHALQDDLIPDGTNQYRKVGSANIEFESKLYKYVNSTVNVRPGPNPFPPGYKNSSLFDKFINDITNYGTVFPTSFTDAQQKEYVGYAKDYSTLTAGYMDNIAIDTLRPSTLFFLGPKSTNCVKK